LRSAATEDASSAAASAIDKPLDITGSFDAEAGLESSADSVTVRPGCSGADHRPPAIVWSMSKGRLEAFSDGVFAVIITIMVLELKAPHGGDLEAFVPLLPGFLTYVLSYVFLGIYWNNHHHLMHVIDRVNGASLWANLHLLFWLSLVPFVTGWMGENHFAALPTAMYGAVLLMAGIAFLILEGRLLRAGNPRLADAIGHDLKGKASAVLYLIAIPMAFVHQLIADAIYVSVAMMWLIPDRRIEKRV
jgi:uncharacterized membrane protein